MSSRTYGVLLLRTGNGAGSKRAEGMKVLEIGRIDGSTAERRRAGWR